jgi:hypothetical protein
MIVAGNKGDQGRHDCDAHQAQDDDENPDVIQAFFSGVSVP